MLSPGSAMRDSRPRRWSRVVLCLEQFQCSSSCVPPRTLVRARSLFADDGARRGVAGAGAWCRGAGEAGGAWVAELAVGGPFHERDLDDDLWLDPVDAEARQAGGDGEWRGRPKDRVEPRTQRQQPGRIEAGADLAGEHEAGVGGVVTDEQRAEADPLALGIREAADDELLAGFDLHLEPVARPAVLVGRVAALGDHA